MHINTIHLIIIQETFTKLPEGELSTAQLICVAVYDAGRYLFHSVRQPLFEIRGCAPAPAAGAEPRRLPFVASTHARKRPTVTSKTSSEKPLTVAGYAVLLKRLYVPPGTAWTPQQSLFPVLPHFASAPMPPVQLFPLEPFAEMTPPPLEELLLEEPPSPKLVPPASAFSPSNVPHAETAMITPAPISGKPRTMPSILSIGSRLAPTAHVVDSMSEGPHLRWIFRTSGSARHVLH